MPVSSVDYFILIKYNALIDLLIINSVGTHSEYK